MAAPTGGDAFRVDVEVSTDLVVARLVGELDLGAEPVLRAALDAAPIGPGATLEVHLDELTFIDSSGLRCLVLCSRRVKHFVVVAPTPRIEKVLQLGGLDQVFDIRTEAAPACGLRIRSEELDGTTVLHLIGELEVATMHRASAALEDAGIGPERAVELHLDQLAVIDSTGLAFLVDIRRRAGSVVLVNPSPPVDRALRISGLAPDFAIRRDAPERASG